VKALDMKTRNLVILAALVMIGGIFFASDYGGHATWIALMAGGGGFVYLIASRK
jgi:hypothetical protein